MAVVRMIVSGGQTGADTAALSFEIRRGIVHGGWCPRSRKRAGSVIPARFHLRETPSSGFAQRTEWNVRDSDGTVIFTMTCRLQGGTAKTARFARQYGKPCLTLVAQGHAVDHAAVLRQFIRRHRIRVLNVAGPRSSHKLGVGRFASQVLTFAFGRMNQKRP